MDWASHNSSARVRILASILEGEYAPDLQPHGSIHESSTEFGQLPMRRDHNLIEDHLLHTEVALRIPFLQVSYIDRE